MDKLVGCVVAAAIAVVGFSVINMYDNEDVIDPLDIEINETKKSQVNNVKIITHSLNLQAPVNNPLAQMPYFSDDTSVKNIGDYIDPDKPSPSNSDGVVMNIGEYIDPDEDPAMYSISDGILQEIGEVLDPDADPALQLSRQNTKIIELGEYIDPDEYFLSLGRTSDGEINLGKVIHPDDVIEKIKD